jgi:hypothetical protein
VLVEHPLEAFDAFVGRDDTPPQKGSVPDQRLTRHMRGKGELPLLADSLFLRFRCNRRCGEDLSLPGEAT